MPYKVVGPPWYVVKKSDGTKMSKSPHPSREAANRQLSALYANMKPGEALSR